MKLIMENWKKFILEQSKDDSIPVEHIVTKGDTLWKIAKKYKISLASLIAMNPKFEKQPRHKDLIYVGEKVLLRKDTEMDKCEENPDHPDCDDEESVWEAVSDYVDFLINENIDKGFHFNTRVIAIMRTLRAMQIYKKNDKDPSSLGQDLRDSYRMLLINFGPSSDKNNVVSRRRRFKGEVDPIQSTTFQQGLRKIGIVKMKEYTSMLTGLFIVKMGEILKLDPKHPPLYSKKMVDNLIGKSFADLYFDEITEYSAVRQDLQSLSSLRSDSLLKVKTYFNSPANRFHKRYKNLPSSTTIADIYARPPRG